MALCASPCHFVCDYFFKRKEKQKRGGRRAGGRRFLQCPFSWLKLPFLMMIRGILLLCLSPSSSFCDNIFFLCNQPRMQAFLISVRHTKQWWVVFVVFFKKAKHYAHEEEPPPHLFWVLSYYWPHSVDMPEFVRGTFTTNCWYCCSVCVCVCVCLCPSSTS